MASVPQIRELVRSYLADPVGLQRFADQFEDLYSEVNSGSDPKAVSLCDEVAAYLGRVAAGFWDENRLKESLLPLSFEYPLDSNTPVGAVSMFALSVNDPVVGRAFPAQTVVSGTSHVVVFGSTLLLPA